MKPQRNLTQVFFLLLAAVALSSIILIGILWISFERGRSADESAKIANEYLSSQERSISLETNRICEYIEAQRKTSEIKFMVDIKTRVYEAYNMVAAVNDAQGGNIPEDELKNTLLIALQNIKSNDSRNKFYVYDLAGSELLPLNASRRSLSSGVMPSLSKIRTVDAFKEISASLVNIKEGFFRYNLDTGSASGNTDRDTQMSFFKLYAPYNWIIGTGDFINNFESAVQKELLQWASSMPMPSDNYFMILNYNGDIMAHPNPAYVGRNIYDSDDSPNFQRLVSQIIVGAKDRSKDFIRYNTVSHEDQQPTEMMAYFRSIPAWRWVVVTWVYSEDLESSLATQQALLAQNVQSQIYRILAISLIMLVAVAILAWLISNIASRSFAAFFNFFEKAATESTEIDPKDQPFKEFARLAVAANNMIAQRKLAEKLLKASELKFKTIFDVSPQVITISGLDGRLLDANEEYAKIAHTSLGDAIGRPLSETFLISKSLQESLWKELNNQDAIFSREIECLNHEGGRLVFLTFAKMIHLGAQSFVLAIFVDITALKQAEDEKLVLQSKLARSKKMEAMGLMAAGVAHDLNNILSGIIGYPQLLLMEPNITEKQRHDLTEILQTGQKAAAVVSDLLTIARGVATPKEVLNLNEIIRQYTNSPEFKQLSELFPDTSLTTALDDQACIMTGSPVHLTKIIMNLVSNAYEAMPLDRPNCVVHISTTTFKTAEMTTIPEGMPVGNLLKLTISDNGPGIPKEDLDKIFEPFYSKKIKGRSGTGLGLAIVWNTVKDHNGYVDVETSTEGTTFTIYFPQSQGTASKARMKTDLTDYMGKGQKILVVDDVEIQRKLASKMLLTLGYASLAVPSGEAAVELLRTEEVDLVILDMIMHPGMSGRETFAAIMQFKPKQKAIIASGMAETEEVAKVQALGAGQFVNKPYTLEDLAVAVHKALI